MTYGLQITNPDNELVVSSDAYTPYYMGVASLSQVVQPTISDGGYQLHTFVSATQLFPILEVSTSIQGTLLQLDRSGNTWTIKSTASSPSAAVDARGFLQQSPIKIHLFGLPPPATGYGLALFGPDGSLRANFTGRPLGVFARINWRAGSGLNDTGDLPNTLPARLGVLGVPQDVYTEVTRTGLQSDVQDSISVISKWANGNYILRQKDQRARYNEDVPITRNVLMRRARAFVIDLTGFP